MRPTLIEHYVTFCIDTSLLLTRRQYKKYKNLRTCASSRPWLVFQFVLGFTRIRGVREFKHAHLITGNYESEQEPTWLKNLKFTMPLAEVSEIGGN